MTATTERNDELTSAEAIQSMIIPVCGVQVMLDRDLARLYGVDVKRLNQQVNRNIERFPERFMHQLTNEEFEILKLQIATSSLGERAAKDAGRQTFSATKMGSETISGLLVSLRKAANERKVYGRSRAAK